LILIRQKPFSLSAVVYRKEMSLNLEPLPSSPSSQRRDQFLRHADVLRGGEDWKAWTFLCVRVSIVSLNERKRPRIPRRVTAPVSQKPAIKLLHQGVELVRLCTHTEVREPRNGPQLSLRQRRHESSGGGSRDNRGRLYIQYRHGQLFDRRGILFSMDIAEKDHLQSSVAANQSHSVPHQASHREMLF